MELNKLTIKEARGGLDSKKFTAVELTQACLAHIAKRNSDLNAFITVDEKGALAQAKEADKIISQGKAKTLTGIPFAVKDSIATKDVRSTAASKILDNYVPPFDATVIEKIRAQGAVFVGKNNCDAFGHGASNENSMYGPVRNPHDLTKVSGGSSGGSAAAVADDMCLFAIGEDTGGSIRQPAAFCGIAGLRPSYGRNSRFGIMAMASSLDVVGPLAKTAYDAALVEEVIAGRDELDATTVSDPTENYTKQITKDLKNLRVGVPKEYFDLKGIDPEVKSAVEKKIKELEKMGCCVEEASLPHTKYAIPVYYIIVPSEDSSNLARLDGVRYGVRQTGKNLFELYAKSRASGFPEEVKRRILIGTYALSAGYYDAYYKKAQRVRTLIRRDFDLAFEKFDVLITPTTPTPAFNVGEKSADPLSMYLADVFVSPAAVAGMPALSVPAGKTKVGLPVGMQIIGPRMGEGTILRVGNKLENF